MLYAVAGMALKRKNRSEKELERVNGTRMQLEMQIHTLEEANLNAETMLAMKKGSEALKVIHGNMCAIFIPLAYITAHVHLQER